MGWPVPSNALLPWRHFSRICGLLKDGKSVAYTSFPDGILWKSNIDGSGLVQMTQPPVYPKLLRWSPDGTQILFNDLVPPGQLVMYVIPAQGGAPQRLLPEDNGPQMDPNWSPDGRKVVFSSAGLLTGRADFSSRVELRMLDLADRHGLRRPWVQQRLVSPMVAGRQIHSGAFRQVRRENFRAENPTMDKVGRWASSLARIVAR